MGLRTSPDKGVNGVGLVIFCYSGFNLANEPQRRKTNDAHKYGHFETIECDSNAYQSGIPNAGRRSRARYRALILLEAGKACLVGYKQSHEFRCVLSKTG